MSDLITHIENLMEAAVQGQQLPLEEAGDSQVLLSSALMRYSSKISHLDGMNASREEDR